MTNRLAVLNDRLNFLYNAAEETEDIILNEAPGKTVELLTKYGTFEKGTRMVVKNTKYDYDDAVKISVVLEYEDEPYYVKLWAVKFV